MFYVYQQMRTSFFSTHRLSYVYCYSNFKNVYETIILTRQTGCGELAMVTAFTTDEVSISNHHVKELIIIIDLHFLIEGVRWRSGRASDSESRGPGFDPHKRRRFVSSGKTH